VRRILVVGASLAGLRAAEALRREGFAGELVLVGEEPHAPYDRPPLSKELLRGAWEPPRLDLRRGQSLDELALELHLGARARGLYARARRVALADGRELAYDGLVIATGAAARALPFGGELEGVHLLRTLDDALAIRAGLAARPRVCVFGAGFIGLEVAATCRALGLSVVAVEPQRLPLLDRLGEPMARSIAELHRAHGVTLRCGVQVTGLAGARRVERVQLGDGSAIDADLVVVGIGVRPATDWLAGSGLALQDGVLCDATCAASLPDVVAAGDVARWPNARFAETMRVEHWSHAVEMASHAARRLLGGASFTEPFAPVPYFWSDQYDVKIQFAGRVRPEDELAIVEAAEQDGKLVALFGREGKLTAVLTWNRPQQLVRYRRMIAEGASWDAARAAATAGAASRP
jgi:3-phenylpropionate/trans-cinnamate dioxygenase ferredoxin reductase component